MKDYNVASAVTVSGEGEPIWHQMVTRDADREN